MAAARTRSSPEVTARVADAGVAATAQVRARAPAEAAETAAPAAGTISTTEVAGRSRALPERRPSGAQLAHAQGGLIVMPANANRALRRRKPASGGTARAGPPRRRTEAGAGLCPSAGQVVPSWLTRRVGRSLCPPTRIVLFAAGSLLPAEQLRPSGAQSAHAQGGLIVMPANANRALSRRKPASGGTRPARAGP